MSVSIITSHGQQCDSNGVPLNAGTIDVYAAGTTTPLTLYPNSDLTGSTANPIVLDAAGRHAMTYIATAAYKLVLKNAAASTIYTHDNIDPGVAIGSGALPVANGGTAGTTAAQARTNLAAAAATDMATAQSDISNVQTWVGYLLTTISRIASGTTAQEPAAANPGFRWDTTTSFLRFCTGAAWKNIPYSGQVTPADMAAASGLYCLKRSRTVSTTTQTISASVMPFDGTIPQIGEGAALTNFSAINFTPTRSDTTIRVYLNLVGTKTGRTGVALFKDGANDAVTSNIVMNDASSASDVVIPLHYEFNPGATTQITFQFRAGTAEQFRINTDASGVTMGGTRYSECIIEEWYTP